MPAGPGRLEQLFNAADRWTAASRAAAADDTGGEALPEAGDTAGLPPCEGTGPQRPRRRGGVERGLGLEARTSRELDERLADIGDEGVDVHESLHVCVPG